MSSSFFRGFSWPEALFYLALFVFLTAITWPKWEAFRCGAAQSEAQYALEEIRAAENLLLHEHGKYVIVEELRKRGFLKAKRAYYDISMEGEPDDKHYAVVATGKRKTPVEGDIWRLNEGLSEPENTHDACSARF